jgi:hypothetical protein
MHTGPFKTGLRGVVPGAGKRRDSANAGTQVQAVWAQAHAGGGSTQGSEGAAGGPRSKPSRQQVAPAKRSTGSGTGGGAKLVQVQPLAVSPKGTW